MFGLLQCFLLYTLCKVRAQPRINPIDSGGDTDLGKVVETQQKFTDHLTTIISFLQVLLSLETTFPEIPWPAALKAQFSAFAIVNLDLSFVNAADCMVDFSHYNQLVLKIGAPFLMSVLVLVNFLLCIPCVKTYQRNALGRRFFAVFLMIIFLAYPSMTSHTLSTFRCSDFDDGYRFIGHYAPNIHQARIKCNEGLIRSAVSTQ